MILSHTCAKLEEFEAAVDDIACCPSIDQFGKIRGCDASNPVYINFCPFCGEDLHVENIYYYVCQKCFKRFRDSADMERSDLCNHCAWES